MTTQSGRDIEREASYFAMCLLIPRQFIEADLLRPEYAPPFDVEDDPKIRALAKRYDVSEQLMLFRLIELGYYGD